MLADSIVSSNRATGQGGGIFYSNPETVKEWVTITGTSFVANASGGDGGGVYNDANMTLASSLILLNKSAGAGGGIFNSGALTRTSDIVKYNHPNNCTGC